MHLSFAQALHVGVFSPLHCSTAVWGALVSWASAVMHCCDCRYQKCAKLADAMEKGLHYTVDEKQKSILLTEDGYETAEDILGVSAFLHMQELL